MKKIFSFFKTYPSALVILALIITPITFRCCEGNRMKQLFLHGSKTVAYVYKTRLKGRTTIQESDYFYYIDQGKFFGESTAPQYCYPETKFYIVYYMPDDPSNSMLDFNQEIRPDCVYKYFPQGENPFMNELKQYGIER